MFHVTKFNSHECTHSPPSLFLPSIYLSSSHSFSPFLFSFSSLSTSLSFHSQFSLSLLQNPSLNFSAGLRVHVQHFSNSKCGLAVILATIAQFRSLDIGTYCYICTPCLRPYTLSSLLHHFFLCPFLLLASSNPF